MRSVGRVLGLAVTLLVAFDLLSGLAMGGATTGAQAQVYYVFPSCENTESLCATEEERVASRERRRIRDATAQLSRNVRELEEAEIARQRAALEQQLGAHRQAEIDRQLEMRRLAQENSAQYRAADRERRRISCEKVYRDTGAVLCQCVGLLPPMGGTACGM
jgi:uncharacterized Zn finger protein (UPF0148 family)